MYIPKPVDGVCMKNTLIIMCKYKPTIKVCNEVSKIDRTDYTVEFSFTFVKLSFLWHVSPSIKIIMRKISTMVIFIYR